MFIQQLTHYVRLGIYINKGTDNDTVLDKCIQLYNQHKKIEQCGEMSNEDESCIRRVLKRYNLSLKIDDDGNPIDIRKKKNQIGMFYLKPHHSLDDDDLDSMIDYCRNNNISVLSNIPLLFILRDSKYQLLLWQYTRSLFYMSQLLCPKTNLNNASISKEQILDDAMKKLEDILVRISEMEDETEIHRILSLDTFLKNKLINIDTSLAGAEVKDLLSRKGFGSDKSMNRIVDLISDKLSVTDLSKGNCIQNILGIANNVANEIKDDLDPNKFQDIWHSITDIFKETVNDPSTGDKIPPHLKNIFNNLMANQDNINKPADMDEVYSNLDSVINEHGLNRDDFFSAIHNEDGGINLSKLEDMLSNINQS
jgi:hypothetical protein